VKNIGDLLDDFCAACILVVRCAGHFCRRPIRGNICAKDEEVTMEKSMHRPPPCLRTDP
jgi:hypothetical protein